MRMYASFQLTNLIPPTFQDDLPRTRYGTTGIGAVPYMTNFNVMLNTNDLKIGKIVAKEIRERSGGLKGVQAMAFTHGTDQVEVACNVDLFSVDETNPNDDKIEDYAIDKCYGNFYMTSFSHIHEQITQKAQNLGCSVQDETKIIGFTPQEANRVLTTALDSNESWLVGKFQEKFHM